MLRGVVAAALFSPWMVPFWQRLVEFPAAAGGGASHLSTLVRLAMTLAAGNLAGPSAWWVWAPMALFGALMMVLLVRQREAAGVWPLAFVVLGSIATGVASRTLVDKYVLVLSGPACMLAAALLVRAWREARVPWERRAGRAAACALALAWLGCGVNLVTQRHWSSLRWVDPFGTLMQRLFEDRERARPIFSHPSARYYYAWFEVRRGLPPRPGVERNPIERGPTLVRPTEWHLAFDRQSTPLWSPNTPAAFAKAFGLGTVPREVVTLRTAGFVDLPDWDTLDELLIERYERVGEPERMLEDPDAALKDRLDPGVRHPRWRIELQRWRLKEQERS
jgi:hypothetical protein